MMAGGPSRHDTVLIVLHQQHSTPGRVGELLEERGYRLDRRCPCIGDPLPIELCDHAAAVVFGGPMSANDDCLGGIAREIDFTLRALDAGLPYLGICLGGQILARALGAAVTAHPVDHVEVGYTKVDPVPGFEALFAESTHFYQFHREGFEVPDGAELLATGGGDFPNQAFRVDERTYGIQFHPEITLEMIHRWNMGGAHRLMRPGAQPKQAHVKGFELFNAGIENWTRALFDRIGLPPIAARRVEAAE